MKAFLFMLGIVFILAGIAGAAFGIYLFWDGLLDIVHYVKADNSTLPDSMLVWGLARVLGVAELIGAGLFWGGIALGGFTIAVADEY